MKTKIEVKVVSNNVRKQETFSTNLKRLKVYNTCN